MTNEEKVERFKNEKIAIYCETKEEAKEFVKWCYANGFRWDDQPEYVSRLGWYGSPEDKTFFDEYENETCYIFNFNGDKKLGYSSKQFYEEEGCEIIKYKDFMKEEKKMTRLEYVVSKGLNDESNTLCYIAHICKYGTECENNECLKCEFYKDINLCVKTLLEEHKEPIKLKQWEYDLLKAVIENYGRYHFSYHKDLCQMKNKGYFKGIYDTSMTLQKILDNCEVVE